MSVAKKKNEKMKNHFEFSVSSSADPHAIGPDFGNCDESFRDGSFVQRHLKTFQLVSQFKIS